MPGVEVGYTTLLEDDAPLIVGEGPVRTGVTAILPRGKRDAPSPIWAGQHDLNGNGEMTGVHWIHEAGYFLGPICLTNTHSVGIVHHAAVKWMVRQYPEHFLEDHAWAMPVVAETYDGETNDICGQHVKEEHAIAANGSAASGIIAEGNVGGGTGMLTYGFKGGTGTASRVIELDERAYTVGVLVQSNFGTRAELTILGVPVGLELPETGPIAEPRGAERGSIIAVIGTDVPLLPIQLRRVAKRATLGIARTGTSGDNDSGDLFLAFSVANDIGAVPASQPQPALHSFEFIDDAHCDLVYQATVQAVEEAVINAMLAARDMSSVKPAGRTFEAIDAEALRAVMRKYGRLIG